MIIYDTIKAVRCKEYTICGNYNEVGVSLNDTISDINRAFRFVSGCNDGVNCDCRWAVKAIEQ